jgi:hypothetical protein
MSSPRRELLNDAKASDASRVRTDGVALATSGLRDTGDRAFLATNLSITDT